MSFTARMGVLLTTVVAVFSHSASAAELYKDAGTTVDLFGEVRTRWNGGDVANRDMTAAGSKIGLSGEHDIGNFSFKGVTKFEYNANTHSTSNFQVNQSYIGFGLKKYGEVDIGRKSTVHDTLFGYDCSWAFGGTAKNGHEPFGTATSASLIQYTWAGSGLTFMGQVQARSEFIKEGYEERPDLDPIDPEKASVRSGLGAGLAWQSDFGLGLKLAYTSARLDSLSGSKPDPKPNDVIAVYGITADSIGAELDFDIGPISLAGAAFYFVYDLDSVKAKQTGFAGRISYNVTDPVHVYGVMDYLKTAPTGDTEGAKKIDLSILESGVTTYTVGLDYWPHKKVVSFLEFSHQIDKLKGSDNESANKVAVGARCYF